ncbi:hypothetical protein [Salipaludibacillus agaradhaerens]|jgi:hypothetical protein|nr:hypothetical protein [Salipaludibacillus agaradhaerens]
MFMPLNFTDDFRYNWLILGIISVCGEKRIEEVADFAFLTE